MAVFGSAPHRGLPKAVQLNYHHTGIFQYWNHLWSEYEDRKTALKIELVRTSLGGPEGSRIQELPP